MYSLFLKFLSRMYLIHMICALYISVSFVKSSRNCVCGYQYFLNVNFMNWSMKATTSFWTSNFHDINKFLFEKKNPYKVCHWNFVIIGWIFYLNIFFSLRIKLNVNIHPLVDFRMNGTCTKCEWLLLMKYQFTLLLKKTCFCKDIIVKELILQFSLIFQGP